VTYLQAVAVLMPNPAASSANVSPLRRTVLLRKLADQVSLIAPLGPALARADKSPLVDRGIALVSIAEAIVLGAVGHERHQPAGPQ
jgi:hypothetical protein